MITCWLQRRTISRRADENAPLPPATASHIDACPACRRHYQIETEMVRHLTSATTHPAQPSPFLHTKIMAQIGQTGGIRGIARPAREGALGLAPAAFAVTCLVLLTLFVWPSHHAPSPIKVAAAAPPSPALSPAAAWPNAAQLTAWAENPDQPLETEMHAVLHDARGAVTALADNFFPEKLRHTLLASSQN